MHNGVESCWNQIGVGGDASCPRLAAVGHCRNCEEYARAGLGLFDREAPVSLREDWSRLLAESKPSAGVHGDPVIVFLVCGEYLALKTSLLERVVPMRPVHSVPSRTGTVFTGLVNIGGELVPCFSAAAALELAEDRPASNAGRILVLRDGETRLACVVDQVVAFVRLSAEDVEAPPVTVARDERAFATGVFSLKGKHAGLLDGPKFVRRLLKAASV